VMGAGIAEAADLLEEQMRSSDPMRATGAAPIP